MTPADGSDYPASGVPATRLPDGQAILLHGGRALLLFEDAPQQIPGQGTLENGERTVPWIAQSWQRDDGAWCGVAMVDTLPAPNAMVREAGSQRHWQLGVAPHVDISAQPLADLVRRSGADSRDVLVFLFIICWRSCRARVMKPVHIRFLRGIFSPPPRNVTGLSKFSAYRNMAVCSHRAGRFRSAQAL